MAVYTSSHVSNVSPVIQIQEQTIVGMGRIGVHYTQSNQTVYEITDHLGNVRATVSSVKINGIPEVLSYTDFYPHGGILPGRNYVSSNAYRYDYQGQEKDPETNWSNFELRMYDANLARWMSPDPYGEFHSPYLAMGNNPVSTIDPDGGKTVAMAPEPPPEPEYDGRQDDWLIERRDAIADGGGYGNRENKFYFEDGVPVNNGHIGSKKFADYEAKYELFEVSRIRQSREAHNKNRIRTSTLKNVFTKIIIRASNLFTKIDYVFADAQSNKGDLINPSGGALRGQDAYGNGHFGASRDGGGRKHMGIDILTTVGQNLVSPVTGKAVNYIGTTSGKPMIDIIPSNAALGIDKVRILYVNMPGGVKAWNSYNVTAGQTLIGTAADLGTLGYPKAITPHIHVQVMVGGKWVDPTPYFFGR
jgi:RHS repeat-associated protein